MPVILKAAGAALLFLLPAMAFQAAAKAGDITADGDITQLSFFETPASEAPLFEDAAKTIARKAASAGAFWMHYDGFDRGDGVSRYFTVSFPDAVDEMTEPQSPTSALTAALGQYRTGVDLWRQTPSWCSTVEMDPFLLEYAYVRYLWLRPDSLEAAADILDKRGAILREVFGTESKGAAAAEGFIAMAAPAQIQLVIFSAAETEAEAMALIEKDLAAAGKLSAWRKLHEKLRDVTAREETFGGVFRLDLSAEPE